MRLFASGLCLSLLAVGCGSSTGSGSSSGPISSSLAGDAALNSLSSTDSSKLGQDIANSLGNDATFTEGLCRMIGYFGAELTVTGGTPTDTALQQGCTTAYNSCKSNPASILSSTSQSPVPTSVPTATELGTSCTATVQDLEDCVAAEIAAIDTALSAFPVCSSWTVSTLGSFTYGGVSVAEPTACSSLVQKCPNGFSDSDFGG